MTPNRKLRPAKFLLPLAVLAIALLLSSEPSPKDTSNPSISQITSGKLALLTAGTFFDRH